MNLPAALVSAGVGAAFFAAALNFYYQPDLIKSELVLDKIFTTDRSKARAAVVKLLHDPLSARFDLMRSVQVDTGKYICGTVNAKNQAGKYAGNKDFVYTVAVDFARIDDDGEIAQRHIAFKVCPMSIEEEKIAQLKLNIPPGAIEMARKVQAALPSADESVLKDLNSQLSAGGLPSGGSVPQAVRQVASASGVATAVSASDGRQAAATFKTHESEDDWRVDRPPAAWPTFPVEHPLAKPAKKRSPAEALALAADAETRFAGLTPGAVQPVESKEEIREALRALLAISPQDQSFPRAWASFVRLRKLERRAS